jgi:hypothetical protein
MRRGGLWAKHMRLKQGANGNTLGKHVGNLGNLMGTHWELERNIEGTCWEQRKNSKNPAHTTQNFKKKLNQGTLSAC